MTATISYRTGDLMEAEEVAVAHGCNTVGVPAPIANLIAMGTVGYGNCGILPSGLSQFGHHHSDTLAGFLTGRGTMSCIPHMLHFSAAAVVMRAL